MPDIFSLIASKLESNDEELYKAYKLASDKGLNNFLEILKDKNLDVNNKHIKLAEIHKKVYAVIKNKDTEDYLELVDLIDRTNMTPEEASEKLKDLTLQDRLYILTQYDNLKPEFLLDLKKINYKFTGSMTKDITIQKVNKDIIAKWFDVSETYMVRISDYDSLLNDNYTYDEELKYFDTKLDNESIELLEKHYVESSSELGEEGDHKYYDFLKYHGFERTIDNFMCAVDDAAEDVYNERKEEFEKFIALDIDYDRDVSFNYADLLHLLLREKKNFKNISNMFNDEDILLCSVDNEYGYNLDSMFTFLDCSQKADLKRANEEFRSDFESQLLDFEDNEEYLEKIKYKKQYDEILPKLNWGNYEIKKDTKIFNIKRGDYNILLSLGDINEEGYIKVNRIVSKNKKIIKDEDRLVRPAGLYVLGELELFDKKIK